MAIMIAHYCWWGLYLLDRFLIPAHYIRFQTAPYPFKGGFKKCIKTAAEDLKPVYAKKPKRS